MTNLPQIPNASLESASDKQEFLQETLNLSVQTEVARMLLAGRLFKIKSENLWEGTSFGSFQEYCMHIVNVKQGAISKMMTAYKIFVNDYQLPIEDVSKIGYTLLYSAKDIIKSKEDAENFIYDSEGLVRSDITRNIIEKKMKSNMAACEHKKVYYLKICEDCGEKHEVFVDDETQTFL